MKEPSPTDPTPFRRFQDFARKIVQVPKSEVDAKLAAEKAKKNASKPTNQAT